MKKKHKIFKGVMVTLLMLVLVCSVCACVFMKQAQFGKLPDDGRLTEIQKSPNYKDGRFQNLTETPTYAKGYNFFTESYKAIFKKIDRQYPTDTIPSIKSDLLNLSPDLDILVWFGHSSYFLQVDGKTFLIDPVFSGNASPISGSVKAFKGTDIYNVEDLPEINYLLITHDHFDHLDYKTILALKDKTLNVICGLGVGAHFEHWGYPKEKIIEKDCYETVVLDSTTVIYTEPARHKSGRTLSSHKTLWLSYILKSPEHTIYMGGDSGYDRHFAEIGNKYGEIDLAILDNGQYDKAWQFVHTLPEEVIKATKDLKAKRLFPVHNSKFVLGRHAWDEPLKEITRLNAIHNIPLVTPMIGEIVNLNDTNQVFKQWWIGIN